MAEILITSGGGGADTSAVTATAADVKSGKQIIDAEGNIISGTFAAETKTATTNGTVTPSSGKYLSSVTVAIPTFSW